MATGKLKFFNRQKGFGFILDNELQKDIFVHFTGLVDRNLQQDDEVTFDIEIEGERKKAVNVRKK
jgi:CspA family cold shock protein